MAFILELLSALLIIFVVIYVYFQWSFQYWKRRNIPFIKPTFPFGNLRNPIKNGVVIAKDFQEIYGEFKSRNVPYGGIFIGPFPILFIVDLDLIKTIWTKDWKHFMSQGNAVDEKADPYSANIFNMDGEKWKQMRPKLSPTFTPGKMKSMFPNVLLCGNLLAEQMRRISAEKEPVDIKETLSNYLAEVVGNSVFGVQCNSFENPTSGFVRAGRKAFEASPRLALRRFLTFVSPSLVVLAKITFFPKEIIAFLKKIIDEVIEYREKTGDRKNDLMQVLLDMRADPKFSLENLSAQAIGFFVAGFETSATTMTFCLYELARRPDIQAKIREEIQECLERNGGDITYDGLVEMKYLDKVVHETLRYYPASGLLQRLCTEDYTLPNGVTLKKGTMVVMSQLGIQRDEEYFPDPHKFDPERFSEENKASRHPMTYTPFGEGPKNCLGIRFALMQMKVGLVSILKEHEVVPDESIEYPTEFKPNTIFLAAKNNILLKIRRVQ